MPEVKLQNQIWSRLIYANQVLLLRIWMDGGALLGSLLGVWGTTRGHYLEGGAVLGALLGALLGGWGTTSSVCSEAVTTARCPVASQLSLV